jgi:hypothetical protein
MVAISAFLIFAEKQTKNIARSGLKSSGLRCSGRICLIISQAKLFQAKTRMTSFETRFRKLQSDSNSDENHGGRCGSDKM